jgi:hypothetical protein
MQFEYRNCVPDENGANTRTCHCAEGPFVLHRKSLWNIPEWQKTLVLTMRNAYGQFFQNGTFPEDTLVRFLLFD